MSFGLGHGKPLDTAPGVVGVSAEELGPLPDNVLQDPTSAWVDIGSWFPVPHQPLEIEIGCGKGTFLLEHAQEHPETNLLGIEWAGEFWAYAADRVRRRRASGSHENVRLLNADATEFIRWRVADGSVRAIHLYFSDPWPKKRHHKKRVIQDAFLAQVWRVLETGGELRVVTDHPELWAWDESHFANWTGEAHESPARGAGGYPERPFELLAYDAATTAGEGELVGSNYERKWRREGRSFYSASLRKLALAASPSSDRS
ncbi:MAG: tRNA (guanosine(46)-N7)-methyltransferase TrmB [Phycisphaerae bacterium]|nr:tRNA (guanosine(46)-N7)-methyltransferase TrmB [Phycisphaerae bacterium]